MLNESHSVSIRSKGGRVHDRGDLHRVLERLGHDVEEEPIPIANWESVAWSCPRDECNGRIVPVDTGVPDLPEDSIRLDASVDHDDAGLHARLHDARSPTVPVVHCLTCGESFEATFRQLPTPAVDRLPEPRIVETPEVLSGRPRIDGTRIPVEHVWECHEQGDSVADIATRVYPTLTEGHVEVAIEWGNDNPDRLAELRDETIQLRMQHDVLQAAVDATVATCLERLWDVLVTTREQNADSLRAVASVLRNGLEHTDGLKVSTDADERRITIDVTEPEIARFQDSTGSSTSSGAPAESLDQDDPDE